MPLPQALTALRLYLHDSKLSVMANAAKRRKSKDNYMKCVLAAPRFYYDGVFHNILLRISLIYRQIYSVYIIREAHA